MRRKIGFEFLAQLGYARFRQVVSSSPSHLPRQHLLGDPNCLKSIKNFGIDSLGTSRFAHSIADSDSHAEFDEQSVADVHNILKNHPESSIEEIERIFNKCGIVLTDQLVLDVLDRNRSAWKPAYILFRLLLKGTVKSSGSDVYNEILDVLGRLRRFDEFTQVLDEMSDRGVADEKTFGVLLNRLAAAHKVEECLRVYERRREFGVEDELVAFQVLVLWLCRYKHVEVAEELFQSKKDRFGSDLKTLNIILNGWCVLGNVREAKRFWGEIIASKCKLDSFTYSSFINALTKKGKLGTAMELFREMWLSGNVPDVVICNNVIDALCFKKRIPEALEVFKEMSERGCPPNAVTYNSLLKYLCKIRRMDKVYALVDELEQKGGSCLPTDVTYGFLLKCSNNPEEVETVLKRMEKNGCKKTANLYNAVFKLYMLWGREELLRDLWDEMERSGLGPDRITYTIMVHGLYEKGKIEGALHYYREMVSKGMEPEPRTEILVNEMKNKLKERGNERKKGLGNTASH